MSHKIERDASYQFGVIRETDRVNGNFLTAKYMRATDCGERCWSGERFLHHGCKSFEDFLHKNPLRLPTNRIFSFFKTNGDQKELVYEGNPSAPEPKNEQQSVQQLQPGMGDAMHTVKSPLRNDLSLLTQEKTEVERLKTELATAKSNLTTQEQTIRDLRYTIADKDREILQTKAQLEAQKQIQELKTQNLLDTHEREISDLRRTHESEMRILEERVALDTQRTLGDMVKSRNGLSDGINRTVDAALPLIIELGSRLFDSVVNKISAPQQYPQQAHPQQQAYPQQPYPQQYPQQQPYPQQTVPARQSAYETNEVYQ